MSSSGPRFSYRPKQSRPPGSSNFSAFYEPNYISLARISYETVLPIQFQFDRYPSGEERLMLECLDQGLKSLAFYRRIQTIQGQRIFREEYEWLMDEEPSHPFSFKNLAENFGFDVARIRRLVLAGPAR